jgi:ribosomal RNA-processing protein 17
MLGKGKKPSRSSASTKRKRPAVIEEITFDAQARKEYLTGFHKRKLQRQKHAQEIAASKEKEERRRQRAQVRKKRMNRIYTDHF